MSIIFLDLDHFKRITEDYGHLTGDEILRQAATRILGEKRDEDMFARYGGEEFACLLRRTPLPAATVIAERMRRAVAGTPFQIHGTNDSHIVTLSAGVAQTEKHMRSYDELIDLADRRPYEAKSGGRNRIVPAVFGKH